MSEQPIPLPPCKWRAGVGEQRLYQRSKSKGGGNQGPTGRKARWYVGRAWRRALGKHGLAKLNKGKR